jgi:hypothetical protein
LQPVGLDADARTRSAFCRAAESARPKGARDSLATKNSTAASNAKQIAKNWIGSSVFSPETVAHIDRQPVLAAIGRPGNGEIVEHLAEGEGDHDEIHPRGSQASAPIASAARAEAIIATSQITGIDFVPSITSGQSKSGS